MRTTFINTKFQRIYGFHHLQSIISLKDSENPNKSLHVRGKAKLIMIDCDLRPLRWYWIKKPHHHSVITITTWAQEIFGKPSSVNTVTTSTRASWDSIYRKKDKCQHPETTPSFLDLITWHGITPIGKVFYGLFSPHLRFFISTFFMAQGLVVP